MLFRKLANLTILIGIPGAGKSTIAKDYLKDHINDTIWCSSDQIRKELYGDENIQGNADTVFKTLHNAVAKYLRAGYNVIYDATNVTRKNRKSIISLGRSIPNTIIKGWVIWAPIETCIRRDKERERTVGFDVIKKFLYRWESPYFDEGFDFIDVLHNVDDDFSVEAYTEKLEEDMKIPHENPHHTLDIYNHCQEAYRLMKEATNDVTLQTVMRFHDIGKPFTKFYKTDENGNLIPHAHYYSHHNVGGYMMYGLSKGCVNRDLIEMSYLVTNHMEPFFDSHYYKTLHPSIKSKIELINKCDRAAH